MRDAKLLGEPWFSSDLGFDAYENHIQFFFFINWLSLVVCMQWGNEEPYRLERKVENLQESCYILATCGKLICLYMVISEIVSSKFGYFGPFFSTRGISQIWLHLYELHSIFFCCQVMKTCPLQKKKNADIRHLPCAFGNWKN